MNSDTAKSLAAILINGYYPPGFTMGEGGWSEFNRRIRGEPQWNKYILIAEWEGYDYTEFPEVIARNVGCAKTHFEAGYLLPDHYEIIQVVASRAVVYSQ